VRPPLCSGAASSPLPDRVAIAAAHPSAPRTQFTGTDSAGKFLRSGGGGHEPGEPRVASLERRRVGEPAIDALEIDRRGGKHVGEMRLRLTDVARAAGTARSDDRCSRPAADRQRPRGDWRW
jgi:hypothetical protein